MRRIAATALALATLVGLAACDAPCPLIACDGDGLAIHAVPEDGNPLREGVYDVWVVADGVEFEAQCSLTELAESTCELSSLDDASAVEAGLAVAGDDAPRDIRVHLRRPTHGGIRGPESVALAIHLDGREIGAADYAPVYEEGVFAQQAAGSCGACEQATVMLDLTVD